jgi:peptide/nickel transport system ATP-binding protein
MVSLNVNNLRTSFFTAAGEVKAVDGVSFSIGKGETLCLVGESGSGKSMTALSIMRLVPRPGRIIGGEVIYEGRDILKLPESAMRKVRGREISMVFQEPMTSLNPVFTVGGQIVEAVTLHQGLGKRDALNKAVEMLRLVGIPDPERRARDYPGQLSGGMRQRVMIAMALSCNPGLLIADEPTTALDVTIQAQILDLIKDLRERLGMAVLLITHDLGIVAETADRVAVMYAGEIVEYADVRDIFKKPSHPYTVGLLNSTPRVGAKVKERLIPIPGTVPSLIGLPEGCRFKDRCYAAEGCPEGHPELVEVEEGHFVRCYKGRES